MGNDQERRACDTQGCANLQVIRKEVEFFAGTLKDTIVETKECVAATGTAIHDLKRVIEGQSVALQAGTREFNIINDDIERLRDQVHKLDTRITVVERGGVPAGRSSAVGYGAASGGIITAVAWIIQQLMGG